MSASIVLQTEIPGPKSRAVFERVQASTPASLGHVYQICAARARGALVEDVDGNTFIDFSGGIGTMNVGHCPESLVQALREQAGELLHTCFMVLTYEPYVALCERLNQLAPGDFPKKTALFNSGAEAVENAVKIARAYTGRPGIVAFQRSFHGRTMFTLAMTGQIKPYKVGFGPYPGPVHHLPYPYTYRCRSCRGECNSACLSALDDVFRGSIAADQVAAIVIEPVLGEGGFVVPPPEFLPKLRALCDQHGILLVADEVQTGFARTGQMFAVNHSAVVPDLLVMAKSLAGGLPLSAVTGRAEILDKLVTGSLGGTYGGNPLACRAALAAIEEIERLDLCARARALGEKVRSRFESFQARFPCIGEVRGLGAMQALELVHDRETRAPAGDLAARMLQECSRRGLLLLKAGADGNVIRTLFPLVISDSQLEEGLAVMEQVLETF